MIRRLRSPRFQRMRACNSETMPLGIDPDILSAVRTVYSTDLGLPDDWTTARRAEFMAAEAEKISWMVRALASTLGRQNVANWSRRSRGSAPGAAVRAELTAQARTQALDSVLSTELYELIASDEYEL